jgi:hypothetical protein
MWWASIASRKARVLFAYAVLGEQFDVPGVEETAG